ncbi:hypothetical protein LUZ60_001893 [Juncus effusus]|nr:hypothetical protein LUZ60_001893 [Juncus effusus]
MNNPSKITSLISTLTNQTNHGDLSQAFSTFSLLRHLCALSFSHLLVRPITSLLHCVSSQNSHLKQGLQLHSLIISLGVHENPFILSKLVSFYSSLGLLPSSAHAIASYSTNNSSYHWNLVISAYFKNGFSSNCIDAYKEMVSRGITRDHFTFPPLLGACGETHDIEFGKEVHKDINYTGIGWNLFVQNALMAMYAKCGDLHVARKMFDEMPDRDVVSWNTIISGYASHKMWKEAFELFNKMQQEKTEINSVTLNTIISGYMHMGDHQKALILISQMTHKSSEIDFVTLVIGLNASSQIGSLKLGKEIHTFSIRRLHDKTDTILNALISMYSRCNQIDLAYRLFKMVNLPINIVTWNSIIAGFALSDRAEETSSLFREMLYFGLKPNYVTIVTYLALCARVVNLKHGRELHCYKIKNGLMDYKLLWNSLLDMYSKSGRVSVAQKVFDEMPERDEISYTSMICGYGMKGEGLKAVDLFNQMVETGLKPDPIGMVAVLSACSHSGLVSEAESLFKKMEKIYKINPKMEHYSCMVDLYSRAGLFTKVEDLLNNKKLDFSHTPAMWASVITFSLQHKEFEIGKNAARKLLDMRTNNSGHYVLIANLYAACECWDELGMVRILMRDLGVRKQPGLAWVDLGNGFDPFLVSDRSNPLADEIYGVLDELYEQMKDLGNYGDFELIEGF